jgi:hypothetical protein
MAFNDSETEMGRVGCMQQGNKKCTEDRTMNMEQDETLKELECPIGLLLRNRLYQITEKSEGEITD